MDRKKTDVRRAVCVWLSVALVLSALLGTLVSCEDNTSDDRTITNKLITQYLTALCEYDIKTMNKNNLSPIETYGDSKAVNASCKVLAARIEWQIENISIDGNAAIAQVTIVQPKDFEAICAKALEDAMQQIGQSDERTPAEYLAASIRTYAAKTDTLRISVEIPMSKIADKWMIGKSHTIDSLISEIRTPTAAVYSRIGQ